VKKLLEQVRGWPGILLVCVAVLGLGMAIGLTVGHRVKPQAETAAPVIPTAEQVAAAYHKEAPAPEHITESAPAPEPPPPSMATEPVHQADPPATETSSQTVVEEEPLGPPSPPKDEAAVPPSPPKERPKASAQTWSRNALPSPDAQGKPIIAVVIDDMGLDRKRSERILQLPGPLTISFMSYAEDLSRQCDEARHHGHELMMHVPMEPLGEHIDPGPGALLISLSPDEIRNRFVKDLDRFSGYVGINNHMGSKFTAYAPGMTIVMEELHKRGLLFIDSLTSEHSVGLKLAHDHGVPTAGRNVFLDNDGDVASVDKQLAQTEAVARKKGNAIAIGHPRDATIQALAAWLPTLEKKGFVLVPVTAVVKARAAN